MASVGLRRDAAGGVVMALAVVLAVLGWRLAVEHERQAAAARFDAAAATVAGTIAARLDDCESVLRAAGAMLDVTPRPERDAWRRYATALRASQAVHGLAGLGFARRVPADAVDGFVRAMRADGLPSFRVFPASGGGERTVVELLEPADASGQRALGYDLGAEPARRAAIEAARDSGRPATTGPVRLLPDDADDAPRGVVLVRAVYREGASTATPDERRAALRGVVFAPLRVDALLDGVLPRDPAGLALEVFDGEAARRDALLHASASSGPALHETLLPIDLPGRRWTLRVAGSDAFAREAASAWPASVAAAGIALCAALAAYLRRDARERGHAAFEARRLAAEVEGRRGAEQAMRDSERRFRDVVEASPTGLLMADAGGRIVLANPQADRLFGYGRGELLGRDVEELVPDALRGSHPAHRADYLRAPTRRLMGVGRDLRGRRKDGSEIPVEIGLSPMGREGSGTVLASIVDLSAREATQRQLEGALREKTLLLDEVHHRVKNNLQVITSLLSLQARGAPPEARAALAECRNRVHAMALTHQLLHENGDLARLHVGEYLTRLARMLADGRRDQAPGVTLRVEGAETPLHLELPRAIPCGLLVNELVGNAYRHAFPDGRSGTIVVGLATDGDDALLQVTDDGVGLPAGVDLETAGSLGFQLVPLLVDQLGGRLARLDGPGTRFELRFPIAAPRRR